MNGTDQVKAKIGKRVKAIDDHGVQFTGVLRIVDDRDVTLDDNIVLNRHYIKAWIVVEPQ